VRFLTVGSRVSVAGELARGLCRSATERGADFLPFQCDACNKWYCLDHRMYDSHGCSAAAGRDRRVIACPVCLVRVHVEPSDDVHEVFDRHFASGECDPSKRKLDGASRARASCAVPTCRTVLGPSNRFVCPECHLELCLEHRLPFSHGCGEKPKPAATPRSAPRARPFVREAPGAMTARLREASRERYTGRPPREVCPTCGERFHDVVDLVSHTATHEGGAAPASTAAAEVCPTCGERFHSVGELIRHSESGACRGRRRPASGESGCHVM
jgi:predicted nucleic acid binding AN1-type Zn finger protein